MSVGSTGKAVESAALVSRSLAERTNTWQKIEPLLQKTLAVTLFLLLWEIAPRVGLIGRTFVPPLSEIIVVGAKFYLSGKLMPHISASLGRSLGGFVASVVVAVPLGILIGWFRRLDRYLNPLLELLRQVNAFSLFPVFILLFGIGYVTKVAIISFVVFWPILLSTISGVKYVDPVLVKCAKSLGVSKRMFFSKVVIPSAVPSLVTGIRIGATYSLLMLVGAEMVGADSGLGYLIMNAQYLLSVHLAYVGTIIVVLFGLLANFALTKLEERLTAWKEAIPT